MAGDSVLRCKACGGSPEGLLVFEDVVICTECLELGNLLLALPHSWRIEDDMSTYTRGRRGWEGRSDIRRGWHITKWDTREMWERNGREEAS